MKKISLKQLATLIMRLRLFLSRILSEEDAEELLNMKESDMLGRIAHRILRELEEKSEIDQPIHENICYKFELGGQLFEVIGFLKAGEERVSGQAVLQRVDNGRLIQTEEDWRFVHKHRAELPRRLGWLHWLVTASPFDGKPGHVYGLRRSGVQWDQGNFSLAKEWNKGGLVLRRRVS